MTRRRCRVHEGLARGVDESGWKALGCSVEGRLEGDPQSQWNRSRVPRTRGSTWGYRLFKRDHQQDFSLIRDGSFSNSVGLVLGLTLPLQTTSNAGQNSLKTA